MLPRELSANCSNVAFRSPTTKFGLFPPCLVLAHLYVPARQIGVLNVDDDVTVPVDVKVVPSSQTRRVHDWSFGRQPGANDGGRCACPSGNAFAIAYR